MDPSKNEKTMILFKIFPICYKLLLRNFKIFNTTRTVLAKY
jgi:hypothetical protein